MKDIEYPVILTEYHTEATLRALREWCMTSLEAMKEACWENVHGGVDWKPIAEGFLKGILPCMDAHDIIVKRRAEYLHGTEREMSLLAVEDMKKARDYMEQIIDELKKAAREHGRPNLNVIK